jgi:putative oxidoreductase
MNRAQLDRSRLAAHIGFAMTNSNTFCAKVSPYLLSIMRIAIAILFIQHGGQKLLGYPPGGARVEHVMTLIGFLTRPVAFILSGEMAVAYCKAHAPGGLWPAQNHGELAVVYCFVFLYLAAAGAGPLSIDALRKKA